MLDIYTDYLICSFGQASATGLARLLSNEISHDAGTSRHSIPARVGEILPALPNVP